MGHDIPEQLWPRFVEEIDLVAAYLNERWYRFPCPPAICRAPGRAALPRPGA